jgi:hypothetical protein
VTSAICAGAFGLLFGMESKTKAQLLTGTCVALYLGAYIVADKDPPRNTKPITFLASQVTVTSSSTIVSGATAPMVMPNMMSSEDKSFSTRQVERQNKIVLIYKV